MGLMDKFLDVMRLNDDDDYEFDNEEYYDDEEDEEQKKSLFQRERETSAASARRESTRREMPSEPKERPKPVNKITPISRSSRKQVAGMEVCVIKPTSIEEEREITETLLNGRAVVINMEGLNVDIAQRIIDFTSGSTFAIHGNLQKISNYIFIATPESVDVSGDFQSIMESMDIADLTI